MGGRRAGAEEGIGILTSHSNIEEFIDLDAVTTYLLGDLWAAIDGWSHGLPRDEVALLNRITERLNRRRRNCDVGVRSSVELVTELFVLHRAGTKQTDRFGADLAVTIRIPKLQLVKTVLFQLKIGSGHRITLDAAQLRDSQAFPETAPRAFVLAIDQLRYACRINSVTSCRAAIPTAQGSITMDTALWEGTASWVIEWFRCSRAPASDPASGMTVEEMLAKHRVPQREDRDAPAGADSELMPARVWLEYLFQARE